MQPFYIITCPCMQVVTYNANLQQLANIRVNFVYNDAGYITVTSSVRNMNVKW